MKLIIKKFFKSRFTQRFISILIFLYMYLIYFTSRIQYHIPKDFSHNYYKNLSNVLLVSWHDKIMILPHISPYKLHKKLHALVSPHNDGRIISDTMRLIGYRIIEGSSNKNSLIAVKEIIKTLRKGDNVVITPDGPRGPRYKMKGSLIEIANKCNSKIIPFTANCTRYFKLNSWDKLIFPLPFGRINVIFGEPIECGKKSQLSLSNLSDKLNNLGVS